MDTIRGKRGFIPSHQGMNSHMNFRMSSNDKKIIETAARLKGFKPNTYARMKLLEIALAHSLNFIVDRMPYLTIFAYKIFNCFEPHILGKL